MQRPDPDWIRFYVPQVFRKSLWRCTYCMFVQLAFPSNWEGQDRVTVFITSMSVICVCVDDSRGTTFYFFAAHGHLVLGLCTG